MTDASQPPPQANPWVLVAGLTALAAVLRLAVATAFELTGDEVYSLMLSELATLAAWNTDPHPPLYAALLTLWIQVRSDDLWLRLPSVILGAAGVPVVYVVARDLFGPRAGLWAAGFLAVAASALRLSGQARMYALTLFLFALALWALLRAARSGSVSAWLGYIVSAALLAYSQGVSLVYVGALALTYPFLVDQTTGPRWGAWVAAHAVVGLAFLPWAVYHAATIAQTVNDYWIPAPAWFDLLDQFRVLTVAAVPPLSEVLGKMGLTGIGRSLGGWPWLVPLLAVLAWTFGSALVRNDPERRPLLGLLLAYALPPLVLFALSLAIRPVFLPRALIATLVPAAILFGAGVRALPGPPAVRNALLGLAFAPLVLGAAYFFRYAEAPGWREISLVLQERAAPTDVVLYNADGPHHRLIVHRYDPGRQLAFAREEDLFEVFASCPGEVGPCLESALTWLAPGEVVWVVFNADETTASVQAASRWLAERTTLAERFTRGYAAALERRVFTGRLSPAGG